MKLLKMLSAVAAAAALLMLSAAPASAVTVGYKITAGVLTTSVGTFNLGPGGTTAPCTDTGTDTITVDQTGTGPWSNTITDLDITSSLLAGSPAVPYIVKISEFTGSKIGTVAAAGPPYAVTQNLSGRVEFYATTGTAPNCVQGNLVCTVQVNFNTTATGATTLTGSTADAPIHTTGDTVDDLAGTGRITSVFGQQCNPPFATLLTNNLPTLANLDLEAL